jgi:hypothetical protein
MEGVLLIPDDDGMTGVSPAGKPYDYLSLAGQIIHNLAFSFITPLGADNDYIHAVLP